MTAPRRDGTIPVWADSVVIGRCRGESCGARIWFAESVKTGRTSPFSGEPTALRIETDAATGREIWHVDFEQSHFRDCANANQFSRRKLSDDR